MFKYSEKLKKRLLDDIYEGKIDRHNLPVDLYEAIKEYFIKGLLKGYTVRSGTARIQNFEDLLDNIQFFSAAKTYTQIKDIEKYIFDDNGDVISKKQFQEIGKARFELWNEVYGEAEYITIIGQAQQAERWQTIEDNKVLMPMLTFSTNGHACAECSPFEGMTRRVTDKIWNFATPLLHFRCACIIIQSDDAIETSKADLKKMPFDTIPEDFRNNVGKSGQIFTNVHPYFKDVPKEDREFAKRNFDLPVSKKA